ncbi:hypothetical protein FF1_034595 [Malus domestica]
MPPENAMEKYIDIITVLYPNWAAGLTVKSRGGGDGSAPVTVSENMMAIDYVMEKGSGLYFSGLRFDGILSSPLPSLSILSQLLWFNKFLESKGLQEASNELAVILMIEAPSQGSKEGRLPTSR